MYDGYILHSDPHAAEELPARTVNCPLLNTCSVYSKMQNESIVGNDHLDKIHKRKPAHNIHRRISNYSVSSSNIKLRPMNIHNIALSTAQVNSVIQADIIGSRSDRVTPENIQVFTAVVLTMALGGGGGVCSVVKHS
jgi:hypothetical protein